MRTITIKSGLRIILRELKRCKSSGEQDTKNKSRLPNVQRILDDFEETGRLCGQQLRDAGIEFTH